MREKMVPYVMKMPPELLSRVKEAAAGVRHKRWWKHSGVTPAAFIRRAIERDLDHRARSRHRGGNTKAGSRK